MIGTKSIEVCFRQKINNIKKILTSQNLRTLEAQLIITGAYKKVYKGVYKGINSP